MKNKVSVLIGTCDAYSQFWKNFDILFNRYWNVETDNIVVSETKPLFSRYFKYKNILPGINLPWGKRMLLGLDEINTEYVVFLLEDYYLTEEINENFIQEHLDILEKYNAQKIMFDIKYPSNIYYLSKIEEELYEFKQNSPYLNSVQPSIWKVDFLKDALKPEYSPWEFELKGNYRTSTLGAKILLKSRPSPVYFNFVRKGKKLSEGWEKLLELENLTL